MKKKVLIVFGLLVVSGALFGKILAPASFRYKEFDKSLYTMTDSDFLIALSKEEANEKGVHYVFRDNEDRFEIRYALFSEEEGGSDYSQMDFIMWAVPINLNIAGGPENVEKTDQIDSASLSKDFNADFGFKAKLIGDKNSFTKGYKHVLVSYYCKKGVGVMCQMIFYNDHSIESEKVFENAVNSFKFN